MLHIIGNKYRITVMSIHVSTVNAWTLDCNISTDTAAACLHLLYAANKFVAMMAQHITPGTGRWLTCIASVQRYTWDIMLPD